MQEAIYLKSVIPTEFITVLRQRAEETLNGIYNDYFSHKTFEEFQAKHLGHTSVVMKIAAFRFASTQILLRLKELLQPHVRRSYGVDELLIHPIFYLRFSFPGVSYCEKHRAVYLDSQPHYDGSYAVEALTFWMALDNIDDETGGLCWFSTPEVLEHFPVVPTGSKNRYSYTGYWDVAPSIDPMLRQGTVAPAVSVGDVLSFDSTLLHGGTKPQTKRRLSFDFRFISPSAIDESSDFVRSIFDSVNSSLDLSNANNLIMLGDSVGAARILRQVGADTENPALVDVASALALKSPDPAILDSGAEVAWRSEYEWLDRPMADTH